MSSLIIQIVDGLKTHRTVISFLKCKHFKGFFPPHQFYVGSLPQQEQNQVQKSANKLQSVIDDIIILEKFLLPLYYHFLYHFSCHLFSLSVFDFFDSTFSQCKHLICFLCTTVNKIWINEICKSSHSVFIYNLQCTVTVVLGSKNKY